MNQKRIAYIYIVATLALILFFVVKSYFKVTNSEVKVSKKTLYEVGLLNMDSSMFEFDETSERILILYFDSECDHCLYEIDELKKNNQELRKLYSIVLVSSEPLSKIKEFASKALLQNEDIQVAKISSDRVIELLGTDLTPHFLVFNQSGELIKEFKGETKIDVLFKMP